MKKNLQLALAITLGLATTVSAQDWSVDSRTRVNNFDTEMSTDQRVRLGLNFSGDAVSVHTSFNAAAQLGEYAGQDFSFGVREAYASTDLMGFASVSAGRMALNFGSGRVIGDNNWTQGNGNTWDGLMFDINNDFADLSFGYASAMNALDTNFIDGFDGTTMLLNAAKDMGDMSFNFTYASKDVNGNANTTMGLEGSYAMANGVDLTFGHYTNDNGTVTSDLTSLGANYGVNDNMAVHGGYDMYGDEGFYSNSGSFGGADFGFGNAVDYSDMDGCTDMSFGGSYTMGAMTFGATMHNVTSDDVAATEDVEAIDGRDFTGTEFNFGYTLSDNASFSLNYASNDEESADNSRMWLSLNVAF